MRVAAAQRTRQFHALRRCSRKRGLLASTALMFV
jgi:hypothetical protein